LACPHPIAAGSLNPLVLSLPGIWERAPRAGRGWANSCGARASAASSQRMRGTVRAAPLLGRGRHSSARRRALRAAATASRKRPRALIAPPSRPVRCPGCRPRDSRPPVLGGFTRGRCPAVGELRLEVVARVRAEKARFPSWSASPQAPGCSQRGKSGSRGFEPPLWRRPDHRGAVDLPLLRDPRRLGGRDRPRKAAARPACRYEVERFAVPLLAPHGQRASPRATVIAVPRRAYGPPSARRPETFGRGHVFTPHDVEGFSAVERGCVRPDHSDDSASGNSACASRSRVEARVVSLECAAVPDLSSVPVKQAVKGPIRGGLVVLAARDQSHRRGGRALFRRECSCEFVVERPVGEVRPARDAGGMNRKTGFSIRTRAAPSRWHRHRAGLGAARVTVPLWQLSESTTTRAPGAKLFHSWSSSSSMSSPS